LSHKISSFIGRWPAALASLGYDDKPGAATLFFYFVTHAHQTRAAEITHAITIQTMI